MDASTREKEKLMMQMAIRQASRGRGATFFHLLFPICLTVSFFVFFLVPAALTELLADSPEWLYQYLKLSPAPTVLAATVTYAAFRRKRLKPILESLRAQNATAENFLSID